MTPRRNRLDRVTRSETTNAGLWLDKFLIALPDDSKTAHSEHIKQVAAIGISEEYQKFFESWKKRLSELGAEFREAKVLGRMAIGLGSESVLETSVTLHRIYGVPYIPGSALKGLAASFARKHLGDNWKIGSPAYSATFGNTDSAGYITYFDALYVPNLGQKALHADVLTVHHKDYYENNPSPPADWDDPTPVQFLSATGKYLIALAAPENCEEWVGKAFEILKYALEKEGVGAKTSSGYGRLELKDAPVDPGRAEADRLISTIKAIPTNKLASELGQQAIKLLALWISNRYKASVAKVIISRTKDAGARQEKVFLEKAWYKALLEIVSGGGRS